MLIALLSIAGLVGLGAAAALVRGRRRKAASDHGEARYRLLADHSTDIILQWDARGVIQYVSPACHQLGYAEAEMVGRSLAEFIDAGSQARAAVHRRVLLAGGQRPGETAREYLVICKDGGTLWLEGHSSAIHDKAGTVVGAVSHLRNVTQRRAAEDALAESEMRYRLLADNATDVILTCTPDGEITYASPSVKRVFGYEPEDLIARRALDLVHPDDRERVFDNAVELIKSRKAREPRPIQYRVIRKTGEVIWIGANPSLVVDADTGRVAAICDFSRDITAQKVMEDELRRKQAQAEAAAVAGAEFLANMSHEIRTPLTGVIGFAGLLEKVEDLPPKAAKFVSRIVVSSEALLSVVNDILDFSKIEAGQVRLDPHPFDPAAFIAETVELVATQAQDKNLTLDYDIRGQLPEAVMADSSRVRQVLLNLLTNAVKFTAKGGISVGISYLAGNGGSLRISVTDTGVGIPPDRAHRLFERFSQADGSISRRFGGTGLGLAICRSLVEIMGGAIGVESKPGAGSTFWFTIAAAAAELPRPVPHVEETNAGMAKARILVVDDVPANRELVRAMLSRFGHDIREAASGRKAIEAARRATYDLILMDLQMPGMDGLTATRVIRETCDLNGATPILALSADVMPSHLAACLDAGMNGHIAKPITQADLLTKVAAWTAPAAGQAPAPVEATG